eukprot:6201575-Pleurochrysis_carterae.AAC.3
MEVVLAAEPAEIVNKEQAVSVPPLQSTTEPLAISAGVANSSMMPAGHLPLVSQKSSARHAQVLDPGMKRVAPFSALKSLIAHMTETQNSGLPSIGLHGRNGHTAAAHMCSSR